MRDRGLFAFLANVQTCTESMIFSKYKLIRKVKNATLEKFRVAFFLVKCKNIKLSEIFPFYVD